MPLPHDALIATAHQLADTAKVETLRYFRTPLTAEHKPGKGDFDPVTAADRAAEAAMRALLADLRPEDAILGEEYGEEPGNSGLTWVLDPIDGTRGYISGAPTWGTLIALCDENGPLLGMIDQPYIGERFTGGFGIAEATGPLGASPLRTRPRQALDQAVLFSTFPEIGSDEERAAFTCVSNAVRLTRYGMDCYAYALLAAGQIDLVIEAGLAPYDICAPIAVIEAAGGVVTDWVGNPAHGGGRVIAAANPQIHAEALALLSPA